MTIDTGINPLGSPIVDASATNKSSASPLEAGAGSNAAVMNGLLSPSWHVYWDAENEVYKINNPIVILPGGTQLVAIVPKLEDGDWVCKISRTDDNYTAEVLNSSAPATTADESDIIAKVPICTISGDEVIQKHIGTIICVGEEQKEPPKPDHSFKVDDKEVAKIYSSADINITTPEIPEFPEHVESVTAVASANLMDNDDRKSELQGKVSIGARAKSGLVVATFEENGKKVVGLDVVGHHDDEDTEDGLGMHTLGLEKDAQGNLNGPKVFSYGDINLADKLPKADKSLKIDGTEVAKIAASADVEITIPKAESVTGASGTLTLYKEIGYDTTTHVIWGKPVSLTIENGVIKTINDPDAKETITRAVEETAY